MATWEVAQCKYKMYIVGFWRIFFFSMINTVWSRFIIFPFMWQFYCSLEIKSLLSKNISSELLTCLLTCECQGQVCFVLRPHLEVSRDTSKPVLQSPSWGWGRGPCRAVGLVQAAEWKGKPFLWPRPWLLALGSQVLWGAGCPHILAPVLDSSLGQG